jgi:hypothetical protein
LLQLLRSYSRYLDRTSPTYWNSKVDVSALLPDERKVFWINLYNTLMLHAYVELEFPTTAVQKVDMVSRLSDCFYQHYCRWQEHLTMWEPLVLFPYMTSNIQCNSIF